MDKGHVVTKIEQKLGFPSYRKGKLNKRVAFVREVVRRLWDSPYEKLHGAAQGARRFRRFRAAPAFGRAACSLAACLRRLGS